MPQPGKYIRTAFDLNLDGIEGHPWRRTHPTTYFNYGLDEATWKR